MFIFLSFLSSFLFISFRCFLHSILFYHQHIITALFSKLSPSLSYCIRWMESMKKEKNGIRYSHTHTYTRAHTNMNRNLLVDVVMLNFITLPHFSYLLFSFFFFLLFSFVFSTQPDILDNLKTKFVWFCYTAMNFPSILSACLAYHLFHTHTKDKNLLRGAQVKHFLFNFGPNINGKQEQVIFEWLHTKLNVTRFILI